MQLQQLVADLPSRDLRGEGATEVTAVTHATSQVTPGALFCCVPGSKVDGHDLAPEAVAAGASSLLVERWLDGPDSTAVPQVRVQKVRDMMGVVASRLHGDPSRHMIVAGVTGTNGKTTTTYVLEGLARAAGLKAGVIGTVGVRVDGEPRPGNLTTPESTDLQALFAGMAGEGVRFVAMEVSSHALAQGRVNGTFFAGGTFLNLSHDHLDFHGTLDAYFEAKALLFDPERVRHAVVNVGDPHGAVLAQRCRSAGLDTVTFAVPGQPGADVRGEHVTLGPGLTEFTLLAPEFGGSARVRTPLVGRFNVANAAAAAATALALGMPLRTVVAGLAAPPPVPGRLERVDRGQPFLALVDYAHTPDALDRVLAAARELTGGRVVVVFGCGGDRDRDKRPVMGDIAARGADRVFVTSDNPRSEDPAAIIEEIVAGVPGDAAGAVTVEPDRRAAIEAAVRAAAPGDVVVVAGKGHEATQTVGDDVLPFDDRVVLAEALEAL